jgi:hypothetical protein
MSHTHETRPPTHDQEPDLLPADRVALAIRDTANKYTDTIKKDDDGQSSEMKLYSIDTHRKLVTTILYFDKRTGITSILDEDEGQKVLTQIEPPLNEKGGYSAAAIDRDTNNISPSDPDYLLRLGDKIRRSTPEKSRKGKRPPSPSSLEGLITEETSDEEIERLDRKDAQNFLTRTLDIAFNKYDRFMLPPKNGSDQLTLSAPFKGKPAYLTCVRTLYPEGHRSVMLALRLSEKNIHYWRLDDGDQESSLIPCMATYSDKGDAVVIPRPSPPPGSNETDPNSDESIATAAKELMDMVSGDPVMPRELRSRKFGQGIFNLGKGRPTHISSQ